jgi:hypothetical protein
MTVAVSSSGMGGISAWGWRWRLRKACATSNLNLLGRSGSRNATNGESSNSQNWPFGDSRFWTTTALYSISLPTACHNPIP